MRRNLLLSGGFGHDFAATSAEVAGILEQVGVVSEVVEDVEAGAAALAGEGRYDLLTVNALRWRMLDERYAAARERLAFSPSPAARDAIRAFVAGGGGLLALHSATICFDDWPEWGDILGAAWRWGRSSHPPVASAIVHVVTGSHPIVEGLSDFEIVDEIYGFLDVRPDVVALLTSAHGGAQHPLVWARRYGAGRVVYDALGHDTRSYAHPAQRAIVSRAAAWLLSEEAASVGHEDHGRETGR
ncbi:MAG TPA: ThuA domain-containing protein [Acidimicrobiales bacterium]|nr:ThuA domain-containing protein [Acidimicrobiales bacterium]